MTRQQALNAAAIGEGWGEEVKKNQLKRIGKLVLKFFIGILAVWTALYLFGM